MQYQFENTVLPWRQDVEMGLSNSLHNAHKEIKRLYASGAKSLEPGALATVPKCHFVNSGLAYRYLRNKRLEATHWGLPKCAPQNLFLNGLS